MKKKKKTVPNDVRVYTVEEIMILLGISRVTAYQLVRSGVFHTVHVGREYRIPKKCFDEWQDSRDGRKRGVTR